MENINECTSSTVVSIQESFTKEQVKECYLYIRWLTTVPSEAFDDEMLSTRFDPMLLLETINQTKADFDNKKFQNFQEFTSLSGYTMKNIEDALSFNYYHEAMHTGVIMSLMKLV